MPITGGFGTRYDLATGRMRSWYVGRDGVQRWDDNDTPCEPEEGDADKGERSGATGGIAHG